MGLIELREMGDGWQHGLRLFFDTLQDNEEGDCLEPYPLTAIEAGERARYNGDDVYYILVDGVRVIGYGFLRGWDEGYRIPSLGIVIHPDERGKGLGRLLMNCLHIAARRKGAKRIMLKAKPENFIATGLYSSLGYKFVCREDGRLVGFVDLEAEQC